MEICRTKDAIRAWRATAEHVTLVPTMGFLHAGHLSLVRRARAEGGKVAVSIFVNPTQFGPTEDLATYPRDEARDLDLLRTEGVDAVFIPDVAEVYDPAAQTIVETTELAKVLIGKLRPGHFRGVATVVTKLFNIIRPDAAVFGEKDYQQVAVIRTMVRDLDMDVTIIGAPIEREADGLAMSSRNVRLTPEDRASAPILARALDEAAVMAPTGVTASRLRSHVRATLEAEPRAQVQSVDIRDAETLETISGPLTRPAVILLAVKFGQVFLIDNRVVTPKE
ncbi:Pantothenate synthetase [Roseibaca ekhonensis]|jgi:pantoate--beta-alanine ligase|uniref:Pantothenate synthetase n=1 Tax=Roseinatronobacter ekhonensis TaxID=254356 RepID=A0A3B0M599_9RHOB|nr:pantoate--beta-alanine ligase [Roseibaca ekhonensis]SUZ31192.1 Pantothenate synthetase [Roseibaca ekhonensis]